MPNPPYIAYIGYPRTGSTLLQTCFFNHPEIHYLHKKKSYETSDIIIADSSHCIVEGDEGISQKSSSLSKIKNRYPDAKIIISIRRQADNLISFIGRRILRDLRVHDFPSLFDTRKGAIRQESLHYDRTITLARKLFRKENVLVLIFDDLQECPENYCARVWRFIGIKPVSLDILQANQTINQSVMSPWSCLGISLLNRIIVKLPKSWHKTRLLSPHFKGRNEEEWDPLFSNKKTHRRALRLHRFLVFTIFQPLDRFLFSRINYFPGALKTAAENLMDQYLDSNQRTSQLLDRDLVSLWHKTKK